MIEEQGIGELGLHDMSDLPTTLNDLGGVSDEDAREAELGAPRILIVDDSRMVRATVIRHIKDKYPFREENDGEQAWQTLLLDPSIQIVISDLSMPKLDGYGLLTRIRQSKISRIKDLPVIMISGEEGEAAQIRARDLGATDFISKGISAIELQTRLQSAMRLSRTTRELEESRQTIAESSIVDPQTGLPTKEFLRIQGEQLVAAARRHTGELSLLAIHIDGFEELAQTHGRALADLIQRKLSKILSAKVRREDTLSSLGDGQFAILAPGINVGSANAFANRLRNIIAGTAMQYKEETLRTTLSMGVANMVSDACTSVSAMVSLAMQRAIRANDSGGNVVVTSGGEPQRGNWSGERIALERALLLLQAGEESEIVAVLPALLQRLMPLLTLAERELALGLPLARIEHTYSG